MRDMYNTLRLLIITGLCGLIWQSCNVINPKESTPTYIHIDSFKFNECVTGLSTSHQITGVAVYYNNNPVGVFDLPATIPILAAGKGSLSLAPMINVNGLSNQPSVYPFYRFDTSTLEAQPGKIIHYTPQTCYFQDTKVYYISRFDGAPGFVRVTGNKDVLTVSDPSLIFEGGTGSVLLSAVGDSSVDSTIKPFAIPGGSAFIEFNYKTEVPAAFALQPLATIGLGIDPIYLAGVKPSDHWQKFYLKVQDINGQYQAPYYNFFLKVMLDDGQKGGRFLIDNIQLVTF